MDTVMDYPVIKCSFNEVTKAPPYSGSDVCDVLEEAIEVLRDSEEGFHQAAQHASSAVLRSELMRYSGQRALFVKELQDLEREYGREEVDGTGSLRGAFHRAWVGIKSAVAKCDDKALLEEAARGEAAAAKAYGEALKNHPGLPADVRHCLSRQFVEIRKGHVEISSRGVPCPG